MRETNTNNNRDNISKWKSIFKTRKYPNGFIMCTKCGYITTPKNKKDVCNKCKRIMVN